MGLIPKAVRLRVYSKAVERATRAWRVTLTTGWLLECGFGGRGVYIYR